MKQILTNFALLLFLIPHAGFSQPFGIPRDYYLPIGLSDQLADFDYPISTESAEAQAFFNQGLQLHYAFAKIEAIRSFKRAYQADPNCALCYWGEALSWGPNLNGPSTTVQIQMAREKLELAKDLKQLANSKEISLIDALAQRYGEGSEPYQIANNQDYYEHMSNVADNNPHDVEIAVLTAEALFLSQDIDVFRNINNLEFQKFQQITSRVFDAIPSHIGACHLYIHAVSATGDPRLGEQCADILDKTSHGISHVKHMPSHIWTTVGSWGKAVESSLQAVEIDNKALEHEGFFGVNSAHNKKMLAFAAAMDGQSELAIKQSLEFAQQVDDYSSHLLILVRFNKFYEIDSAYSRPIDAVSAAIWEFCQGYAALQRGDYEVANSLAADLAVSLTLLSQGYSGIYNVDIPRILQNILLGELLVKNGNLNAAIAYFENSIEIYDKLPFSEPEILPFSPRHWLANLYILRNEFDSAIAVLEGDLVDHPNNGWSLFGIYVSTRDQQSKEIALEKFNEAWIRADFQLNSVN